MPEDWPPDGYSTPNEYEKSEPQIIVIAIVVTALFGTYVLTPINVGVDAYLELISEFAGDVGASNPIIVGIVGTAAVALGMVLLFKLVVTPFHEWLHYEVGRQFGMNPDFGYERSRFFNNPRVVALSTNIPVWKNLAMIIAPFVTIGFISLAVIQVSSGLVAGTAAVVLWINSAASAQDLYHFFRLIMMDSDTKFANFEVDNEIRTEYATPE